MGQAVPYTSRTFTRKPNARQRSSAKKTWTPLVEDTLQDDSDGADSEVCGAAEAGFCDGCRAKQKTADIRKARSFQETSMGPSTKFWKHGTHCETIETTLENATASVLRN